LKLFEPSSFFVAIVSFLILFWLLKRYAFGPLFSIMEQRRVLVQSQLSNAESNRLESEKLLTEQKQAIIDAKKSAYDILEQARQARSFEGYRKRERQSRCCITQSS
jgi:F-type H+-transporting ATPase subunit b